MLIRLVSEPCQSTTYLMKKMERTQFEKLEIYQLSEDLADKIWKIVGQCESFEKNTIGIQLVKSSDSVVANIAEGTGRGSFKENIRFAIISRALLFETKHFLRRAYRRKLLSESQTDEINPHSPYQTKNNFHNMS